MEINNKVITEYIYKIAEDFGSPVKDAILYMNFGKLFPEKQPEIAEDY